MNNILFENKACIVINKRCGEDSERPQGFNGLKPVHRLDQPASGCLLLAKTREVADFLSKTFQSNPDNKPHDRQLEKLYWAIAEKPKAQASMTQIQLNDYPHDNAGNEWKELVHWISSSGKGNKSFAHNDERPGAKRAVMRLRQAGEGVNYLYLEIDLVTGRHHQIRAQLAALGLHIKGDLKYGSRRSEKTGGIRLHARSLRFPNPLEHDNMVFTEALPPLLEEDSLWQDFMTAVTISNPEGVYRECL